MPIDPTLLHAGYRERLTDIRNLCETRVLVETKMRLYLYKVIIRPVVTYAAETICPIKKDEERLKIFERKIIRKIHELLKENEEEYRLLMNHEEEEMLELET